MSMLEIELTPETERRLREKAKRCGLEPKAYVQALILLDLQQEDAAKPNDKKRHNVMDFQGAGRETWAGIDVQAYVTELRNELDR